jgi:hypothetical protein
MSLPEKLPTSESPKWIQLTSRAQTLVALSKVEHWFSHWDPNQGFKGKTRRCGGERCALCALGAQKQLRFVILVKPTAVGSPAKLIEFREPQRNALEMLIAAGTVGTTIKARKEGNASNSPAHLEVMKLPKAHVIETCITRLVQSLGLPPLYLEKPMEEQPGLTAQVYEMPAVERLSQSDRQELFADLDRAHEVAK